MIIAKQLKDRFDQLKSDRGTWEDQWQELAEYLLPHRATITQKRVEGEKMPTDVYDASPRRARRILSAGLHGYLTNPHSKWFSLRTRDREIMDMEGVRDFLSLVEEQIYDVLNNSNFNEQMAAMYDDLSSFYTACLYEEEDPETVVRFDARSVEEIFIAEDARGNIDTVYRPFEFTARQAFQVWGARLPAKIVKSVEEKPDQKFEFLHCVGPRHDRDVSKVDAANFPHFSRFISLEEPTDLSHGGYQEMPYFVTRFLRSTKGVYGYGPGTDLLPDIKTLNAMNKALLKAAAKVTDPPIVLPHDGFVMPIRMGAAAINYLKPAQSLNRENKIQQMPVSGQLPVTMELIQDRRQQIFEGFHVDLFMMLANRPREMTATEVMERVQEKMLILGPTLGQLTNELLGPIVVRTFNILARNLMLPPPPPALQGREYTIEYVSPLAKSQKAAQVKSLQLFLGAVGEMSSIWPSVLDKVDSDEAVDQMADMQGTDPKIMREDSQVQEVRQRRQELEEQAQRQALMQGAADIVKTGAEAGAVATESADAV